MQAKCNFNVLLTCKVYLICEGDQQICVKMKYDSKLGKIKEEGLQAQREHLCKILDGGVKWGNEGQLLWSYQSYLAVREQHRGELEEYDEDDLKEALLPLLKRNYPNESFDKVGLEFMNDVIVRDLVENAIEAIIKARNASIQEFSAYQQLIVEKAGRIDYEEARKASQDAISHIKDEAIRQESVKNRIEVISHMKPNAEVFIYHLCSLLKKDGSMIDEGVQKELLSAYEGYLELRRNGENDEAELYGKLSSFLKLRGQNVEKIKSMDDVIKNRLVEKVVQPIIDVKNASLDEYKAYEKYQAAKDVAVKASALSNYEEKHKKTNEKLDLVKDSAQRDSLKRERDSVMKRKGVDVVKKLSNEDKENLHSNRLKHRQAEVVLGNNAPIKSDGFARKIKPEATATGKPQGNSR